MTKKRCRRSTYIMHKTWFKAVFLPNEWLTWSGRKILAEARELHCGCDTTTFCQIRKEIIADIKQDNLDDKKISKADTLYLLSLTEVK